MRFCSRLILSAILLAALAANVYPQKKLCPKPPPSPFKHSGRIFTSIERAGARTTLEHPVSLGKGLDALHLAATFMHQDPRRPTAPTLELILFSEAPAAPASGGDLALLLDGQPLALGRNVGFRSQGGTRAARVTLSYADVSRLTRARKVMARVGASEYEFTNNHLEALREIASQLAPSPSRWSTVAEDRLGVR